MERPQKKLKALLCQILPKLKSKKENIERVGKSLQIYNKDSHIDIIIFPQMSFVGYNFKDAKDIQPYAVQLGNGLQFQFCIDLAKRLNTYVAFGYVEKSLKNQKVVFYNSAAVIDRKGQIILNTRKTHLYYCDQLWSEEGDGFKSVKIINRDGKIFNCAVAICMDINPKNFTSGQYQLADYMKDRKSEVLLFLTNWTDSDNENTSEQKSVENIFNYWLHRLRPLLTGQNKHTLLFLAADRVGVQHSYFDKGNCHFMGGSCAMKLNHQNKNYILKNLGKKQEGYLMIQTTLPQ